MTQDTILIIVGTVVGIIYLYYFYRLFKKLRTFPNHGIVGLGILVMILLGVGIFKVVTRGVPFIIDTINKKTTIEKPAQQTTTSGEQQSGSIIQPTNTGISSQSGDILFSGLNANATDEEVVSWSTLKDKLKHVEVTEKHGSPSGNGSAQ